MLIVFAGLPGVGKTTLARGVSTGLGATYLRIDAVEQAIREALGREQEIGAAGYTVAQAVAEANLALGRTIVVDGVNPVAMSRAAWRALAARAAARLLEVEVVCSDAAEHRRRVETRTADIEGHALPTWASVLAHAYDAWDRPRLVVDTAKMNVEAAVAWIVKSAAK